MIVGDSHGFSGGKNRIFLFSSWSQAFLSIFPEWSPFNVMNQAMALGSGASFQHVSPQAVPGRFLL
jgi:hypothetical protein